MKKNAVPDVRKYEMNREHAQLDDLLARLAGDGFDALTLEQIARIESACEDESFAARVAELSVPRAEFVPAPGPTAGEWQAAWNRIERAVGRSSAGGGRTAANWTLRLWQATTAAAACLLLVAFWRAGLAPSSSPSLLRLSTNSQIESIESIGDETAYVADLGDDSGSVMIWFLDDES